MKRCFTRWKKYEAVEVIRRSRLVLKNQFVDVRIYTHSKENARILVVTPRKSGNAVQRNLFRRRWNALFYQNHFNTKGSDWIIFAKPGMSQLTYGEIVATFTKVAELCSSIS